MLLFSWLTSPLSHETPINKGIYHDINHINRRAWTIGGGGVKGDIYFLSMVRDKEQHFPSTSDTINVDTPINKYWPAPCNYNTVF